VTRRDTGREGEDDAVDYLTKKGYRILRRNYRFGRGEIDIIAEDGDTLVFVEVKSRIGGIGLPEEAVTERKRRQLATVAEGYLMKHDIGEKDCRFDVVAIFRKGGQTEIRHLSNIF